jgi:DNA-directed RNA polymerase alpha subunit
MGIYSIYQSPKMSVSKINQSNKTLTFTLSNTNVSIANALRRIILSEISTVVFRTTPYEKNRVKITVNTTRMNNEIIKQRMSCIPIYITEDMDIQIEDYIVEVDKKNETNKIDYVTTKDFRVKNIKTKEYLNDDDRNKIFPPDDITGDYIELVRLRPKVSDNAVEQLAFTATFDYGTAKEDGAFNVISTCSYAAAQDKMENVRLKWDEKAALMEKDGATKDEIKMAERDWYLLEAKRIIKDDEFNFIVESVGPYKNTDIVYKATRIMTRKLEKLKIDLEKKSEAMIKKSSSTIPNCYDIILEGEDYTLGKVVEFMVYNKFYNNGVTYCGFIKPHPHIPISIIRIGFADATNETSVVSMLSTIADDAISIYDKISKSFQSGNSEEKKE